MTPMQDDHPGAGTGLPFLENDRVGAGFESEGATWALAFLPLGTVLGYAFAAIWGLSLGPVSAATIASAAALVVSDKRALARAGRLRPSSAPSTAWMFFPPGYLFRRASVLRAPRTQAWIAIACFAVAFAGRTALVAKFTEAPAAADPVLPACAERAIIQDVLNVFDDVGVIRTAGVHGVVLSEQAEVGQGPGLVPAKRYCAGRVEASNTQSYKIEYELELQQGQVVVRLELDQ